VERVVILGRRGAGKSALAQKLSRILALPVIELDSIFWQPCPQPTPEREWAETQRTLVARDRWIIDGDLGPYGTGLELRLRAADTVIVLDFPLWRCVWRALRRSLLVQRISSAPVLRGALVLGVLREDIAGAWVGVVVDGDDATAGPARCGLCHGSTRRADPDATTVSASPSRAALNNASAATVAAPANITCITRICRRRASAELVRSFVMRHV
jgi:adenylate kinase family enzyme